jgi:hypothetical protein
MVFVQLRVTVCEALGIAEADITNDDVGRVYKVIKEIVETSDGEYTVGFEIKNKRDERLKGHFHACYELSGNPLKDTYQRAIKKKFRLAEIMIRGNTCYSIQFLNEPEDYLRWIRYPLKERPVLDLCKVANLENLIMLAKDERERSVTAAIAREKKRQETTTFKEKMFLKFESFVYNFETKIWEKGSVSGNRKTIYLQVAQYYSLVGKAINFTTMMGYVDLYMYDHDMMSMSNFFDLRIARY